MSNNRLLFGELYSECEKYGGDNAMPFEDDKGQLYLLDLSTGMDKAGAWKAFNVGGSPHRRWHFDFYTPTIGAYIGQPALYLCETCHESRKMSCSHSHLMSSGEQRCLVELATNNELYSELPFPRPRGRIPAVTTRAFLKKLKINEEEIKNSLNQRKNMTIPQVKDAIDNFFVKEFIPPHLINNSTPMTKINKMLLVMDVLPHNVDHAWGIMLCSEEFKRRRDLNEYAPTSENGLRQLCQHMLYLSNKIEYAQLRERAKGILTKPEICDPCSLHGLMCITLNLFNKLKDEVKKDFLPEMARAISNIFSSEPSLSSHTVSQYSYKLDAKKKIKMAGDDADKVLGRVLEILALVQTNNQWDDNHERFIAFKNVFLALQQLVTWYKIKEDFTTDMQRAYQLDADTFCDTYLAAGFAETPYIFDLRGTNKFFLEFRKNLSRANQQGVEAKVKANRKQTKTCTKRSSKKFTETQSVQEKAAREFVALLDKLRKECDQKKPLQERLEREGREEHNLNIKEKRHSMAEVLPTIEEGNEETDDEEENNDQEREQGEDDEGGNERDGDGGNDDDDDDDMSEDDDEEDNRDIEEDIYLDDDIYYV